MATFAPCAAPVTEVPVLPVGAGKVLQRVIVGTVDRERAACFAHNAGGPVLDRARCRSTLR